MPKKIIFTKNDIKFIQRYLLRIKDSDSKLGLPSLKCRQIKEAFSNISIFRSGFKSNEIQVYEELKALDIANEKLLKILDSGERERLSKARYAFNRKRNKENYSLDVTFTTHWMLDEIAKKCKEYVSNADLDVRITAKSLLETIVADIHIQTVIDPEENDGLLLFVDNHIERVNSER